MKKLSIVLSSILVSTSLSSWAAEGNIQIWAWNINVPLLQKAAEAYVKDNPNAVINVSDIGSQDVYTKLSVGLQANGKGLADVILVEDTHLKGYLENWPNGFTDLSALGYDEYAQYFPQFKVETNQMNGKFYGMPFDAGPVGVFYRPSIFEKAGVDPKSIETWDDYIAAGVKIKEVTGSFMTDIRTDEEILVRAMIGASNTHYFDKDGNIAFNSPEMIEVFTNIKKMDEAGILYTGNIGWDSFVQAFVNNRIVATPSGAWLAGTIERQAPNQAGDWGVMPLPKNSQGKNASNIGGSNFVIPSSSQNVELAYDFMRFFTTTTEWQEAAFVGGLFPSLTPVYALDSFNAPVEFFNNQPIWAEFGKTVQNIPAVTFTMDYSLARQEMIKVLSDVVLNDADVQKALNDAAKRLANQTGRKINKY
ncbi:MAG: ABC transporter substrate-binding protein [Alphaproteobacteria bacterium]